MGISRRDFLKVAGTVAGTIYLPGVFVPPRLLPARLGVQIEGDPGKWASYLVPDRLYQWSARWDRGLEYPDALRGYDQVIGIKVVPQGYRLWPEFAGSPPQPEHYGKFVEYAQAVIDRYSPCAIELFNEPDVRVSDAPYPELYGAWVADSETMYQGGRRYGEFCSYVYPRLRGCKVLAGALMATDLDFLRGALDAGLRADAISFHCYVWQDESFDRLIEVTQKLRGLTGLPLVCTETAVLGDGSVAHQRRKAQYVDYIRSGAWGWVEAVNWYTIGGNGWEHSDLFPGEAWRIWAK